MPRSTTTKPRHCIYRMKTANHGERTLFWTASSALAAVAWRIPGLDTCTPADFIDPIKRVQDLRDPKGAK